VEAACGVGMGENAIPDNQIIIYPNPAADQITIEIPKSEKNMNGTITIFGMSGQVLMQQQVQASITEINVSSLPKGIYFVRLVYNEKIEFGKFIKE
jgi:hypothetical protein